MANAGRNSQVAVRERPILFSAPMVRALLEGRKTQTRRIIKPQPKGTQRPLEFWARGLANACRATPSAAEIHAKAERLRGKVFPFESEESEHLSSPTCPYGQPGDRLWVKETHALGKHNAIAYRADGACGAIGGDGDGNLRFYQHGHILEVRPELGGTIHGLSKYGGKWRPSLFMKRDHSRITLEIVSVRVERVKDISEEDAIAEGVDAVTMADVPRRRDDYRQLWDSIYGVGSWDINPWCWCLSFQRIANAS